jgi:hypothetical protein
MQYLVQVASSMINNVLPELDMRQRLTIARNISQALTQCMEQTISPPAIREHPHIVCVQLKMAMWRIHIFFKP